MELLEKHFELAVETPDGIKKLRELILTLAMKGILVPQDPNDQPASELLTELTQERNKLIDEGIIKSQNFNFSENEIPYQLPCNWEWIQLGQIVKTITKGSSPNWQGVNYTNSEDGILFITSENVDNYKLLLNKRKYVEKKFNDIEPRSILQKNDILMNIVGASIGRVAYYDLDEIANINQAVCLIRFIKQDYPFDLNYILHFLNSPLCISYMFEKQVDNARANLSMSNISRFLIPVPPLCEQKLISKKIKSLFSHCDKLEAERNERNTKRIKVNTSALNKLLKAPDKKSFKHSWNFIEKNFDELYSVPENVEELKKAILQLAVMGKLVPQDPNDQPASELLKQIAAEKNRLIKEGKIKKQPDLPPIRPEEIPYELPKGWEWVRLGKITESISDGVHYAPTYINMGIPCISAKDIYNDSINQNSCNYVNKEEYISQKDKFSLRRNSLLVTKSGSIGRTAIYDGSFDLYLVESVGVINLPENKVHSRYIKYLFNLIFTSITYDGDYVRGLGVKHLTLSLISTILVPLPSFNEQQRIISKIDQLITFCKQIDEIIFNSKVKQSAIINSILGIL